MWQNLSWDLMVTWRKLIQAVTHIPWCEVSFCRRERNWVVDGVAQLEHPSVQTLKSYLPHPIQDLLCPRSPTVV